MKPGLPLITLWPSATSCMSRLLTTTVAEPPCFGVFNHLASDAVVFGEAGVEVIEFSQYPAVHIPGQTGEVDQGRVADGFDGRGGQSIFLAGK